MTEAKPISVVKFALGGFVAALIFNLILRILLNLDTAYVILPIPIVTAVIIAWWFSKSTGRAPTKTEKTQVLWIYGGVTAIGFAIFACYNSMYAAINFPTAFIYLLYFLPYPALLQYLLTEKQFNTYFIRRL